MFITKIGDIFDERLLKPDFINVYLFIYLFASMLSHLVTFDLSRFVQVEYSQFSC